MNISPGVGRSIVLGPLLWILILLPATMFQTSLLLLAMLLLLAIAWRTATHRWWLLTFITLTSWLPAIVGTLAVAFASHANQESAGAYVFIVTLILWRLMLATMLFWAIALGIAGLRRFLVE